MGQSPIEPAHVIPRLTKANGKSIVLDPMMGSGVTGIVALGLKRRFIGIDKDLMTFQIAKANIGKFVSSGSDLRFNSRSDLGEGTGGLNKDVFSL